MRVRITFAKTEAMRFTSHLDVYRAWERTFRRTKLKLVFSQGYNPRPKIQIAAALPLGFTSQAELLDVWLKDSRPIEQIRRELIAAAPPGLQIIDVQEVNENAAALQNRIISAEYLIELSEAPQDLEKRIDELLSAETLPRKWKGKPYDLRALIERVESNQSNENGNIWLRLRLKAEEGNTGRPEEVLAALDIPIESTRIHRTALHFKEDKSLCD